VGECLDLPVIRSVVYVNPLIRRIQIAPSGRAIARCMIFASRRKPKIAVYYSGFIDVATLFCIALEENIIEFSDFKWAPADNRLIARVVFKTKIYVQINNAILRDRERFSESVIRSSQGGSARIVDQKFQRTISLAIKVREIWIKVH